MTYTLSHQAETRPFFAPRYRDGAKRDRIFLIHANDHSGHRAYYFLLVFPLKLAQFKKEIKNGNAFDLEQYGQIVASGYGESAPEYVRETIREEYGWRG